MSKTLFCTNPTCNAAIEVVDAVESVVCPNCNTWQLVSMADSIGNGSTASENSNNNSFNSELPPPPFLPSLEDISINTGGDSVIPPNLGYNEPENDAASYPFHPDGQALQPDEKAPVQEVGFLQVQGMEVHKLKVGKNVIGRKGTDIEIKEPTISRKHCILEVVQNGTGHFDYFIYDIGHEEEKPSTNGVFIGGRSQRLADFERIKLFNGSVITIGNVHLVLTA